MGTERKQSSGRLRVRLSQPPNIRNTLIPCPACEGQGSKVHESGHRYWAKVCKWCEGLGMVDDRMYKMFRRWLGIYHKGILSGRCRKPI